MDKLKDKWKDKLFYKILLLNSTLAELIYHCFESLDIGRVVKVKLKGSIKDGVIISKINPPSFKTLPIDEVESDFIFLKHQIDFAKFISEYYFSSFSEALSLFTPHRKEASKVMNIDSSSFVVSSLPKLSLAQQKAYNELSQYSRVLLFGLTGSGKTELYITKIAQILKEGKSAILLMPEIALTPQMEKRLKMYFSQTVAIWHSKLTKKQKTQTMKDIQNGKIRVVAGARSALFVPLSNLGLIIVDEEHDDSYKSKRRPRYSARDLAIYFAKELKATLWLGSATPTLNSYVKYPVVRLKEPFIKSKKIFKFISGDTITPEILSYIKDNLEKKEQTLIFVPTRANFKYIYCSYCGSTHRCPFCSVGMSLNRWKRYLKCHYCNYIQAISSTCQECGHSPLSSNRIGTQEVIEIIKENIKDIRVEQFDRDAITTVKKLQQAIDRIINKEVDLIVGTQMLSKGHDYPNITLSIITGIDYLLGISDYRARERSIALLHQIAGRSGRVKEGLVLIQTSQKEQFLPYITDYEKFLSDETEFAKGFYPPFMRLSRILVSNRDEFVAKKIVDRVVNDLKKFKSVEVVGYGKAPIEKIANRFRYFILLRAKKATDILIALYSINRKGIEIDMDPIDFS